MLNPLKVLKKALQRPVLQQEVAPASETAGIALYLDAYSKILPNQDTVLMAKGYGDLKIYQEVLRDDQVKSTFQQRRLAVIAKPLTVEAGADDEVSQKAADALSKNLKAINFDDITDKMLYAIFYGYGVGEVVWGQQDNLISIATVKVRDRARFAFNIDRVLFLLKSNFQHEKMPDRKFWTLSTGSDHSDNPYGLGLAHYLYWLTFFKRNDIKFWLIFLEKFGQPTAVGKLPTGKESDKATRSRLLQALRAIATETAIVVPEGAEVSLLEAARSGAADYEALKNAMDAAISKVVLSQTMTTDNGSSRSQSETHADVRDMVVTADADLLCESFNQSVVQWWFEYNQAAFPGASCPRVYRKTIKDEDLDARAERDTKISSLGFEPTEEYIRETYGEGWVKKQGVALPVLPAQNFSEANLDINYLQNRADQMNLVNAADQVANDYEVVLGQRVNQLLDFAESEHADFESTEQFITQLMREMPPANAVNVVQKASFASRLLGLLRGQ